MSSMTANQKKKRILVAEDDIISMLFITRLLTDAGFEIIQAHNGKMAVEKLQKHEIDLVFMDIQMPIMDGFTAARQIRQFTKNQDRHIPIIALTAYSLEGEGKEFIDAGMNDFISKPIDIDALRKHLIKWLY